MTKPNPKPKKILAIASGGGHWIQLLRLRPAWSGLQVTYVTTTPDFKEELLHDARERGEPVPDYAVLNLANRWNKLQMIRLILNVIVLVLRVRPHYIITTGAAHGYFALRVGKALGCRTIWVDSIANSEELSLSGQLAKRHADVWLTQWEHLARPDGPDFQGAVL